MLGCNCLNVIIETEGDGFVTVSLESLGLTDAEKNDSFFKQEIQQVGKLININKSHAGLIETRIVGSWVVHYCINCDVHSHAVHREKGAACILINKALLASPEIEALRSSETFSKLYKIIIDIEQLPDDELVANNSYFPNDVENVIRGLKQIAADGVRNEAQAVEERIKQFADQQYNQLSELRDRAFREQQALIRIILRNSVESARQPASTNNNVTMTTSNPLKMPSRIDEPLAAGRDNAANKQHNSSNPQRHTPKRQKSCPGGVLQLNSFDAEGLFDVEGVDELQSEEESDGLESDLEDVGHKEETERISIRASASQRNDGNAIARSLPMSIPVFLSQSRNKPFEDLDDFEPVPPPIESNMDIAASIKALAKSVHGDPVFGDLPKPRYTHI